MDETGIFKIGLHCTSVGSQDKKNNTRVKTHLRVLQPPPHCYCQDPAVNVTELSHGWINWFKIISKFVTLF